MFNIIVADDNDDIRNILELYLTDLLEGQNYYIETAKNGKEVLEKLEKKNFDLIFLDIAMPELGGLDVVTALRDKEKYNKVPKIAISAFAMEKDRSSSLEAGFDDYIKKPLYMRDLQKILSKYLKLN